MRKKTLTWIIALLVVASSYASFNFYSKSTEFNMTLGAGITNNEYIEIPLKSNMNDIVFEISNYGDEVKDTDFYGQSSNFSHTYIGNENYTVFIEVPLGSYIKNMTLEVTGE